MLFRNSLRVLMENFKNAYKILLYKLAIGLIAAALCCAMILPGLNDILQSEPVQNLQQTLSEFLSALFSGHTAELDSAREGLFGENGAFKQLGDLLLARATEIILTLIGCSFVWLLQRFADSLCYFAVGSVINDKMEKYATTRLSISYVSNLKKATVFSLAYVPVSFLFDAACACLAFVLLSYLPLLFALFLTVLSIVLLQSLKLTLTGRWMPAMTADGARLNEAIVCKDKAENKQLTRVFSHYLVVAYAIFIVNVAAAVFTFGSALLITIPTSYLYLICTQYVHYFTLKGKKYFLTFDKIIKNPDRGDSENFFEYINEIEADKSLENGNETQA